jgi:hypothetical protein
LADRCDTGTLGAQVRVLWKLLNDEVLGRKVREGISSDQRGKWCKVRVTNVRQAKGVRYLVECKVGRTVEL